MNACLRLSKWQHHAFNVCESGENSSLLERTNHSDKSTKFSSQIVKGFGFSAINTTIISTCPAAVIQLGTFLSLSYIASHHDNVRLKLAILVSVPPLIGACLLHTLPKSNTAGRLAGYYLTYTCAHPPQPSDTNKTNTCPT